MSYFGTLDQYVRYCKNLRSSGWVPNPLSKPNSKLVTHKSTNIGNITIHLYTYTYSKYNYVLNTVGAEYSNESEYYDDGLKEKLGGERSTLGG